MISALLYLLYAVFSISIVIAVQNSEKERPSYLKHLFKRTFEWCAVSTVLFALAIILFQGNQTLLAYGMIAGRIPLLVGLVYLTSFNITLLRFERPHPFVWYTLFGLATAFVVAHATIWLGAPTIENSVILWKVPSANLLSLAAFFLISFVFGSLVLLGDSFRDSNIGARTGPRLLGLGLLFVGLGAAMISLPELSISIFFQVLTGIGVGLIALGIRSSSHHTLSII